MHRPINALSVIKNLKLYATTSRVTSSARFFKTGKGQYGYGDSFIGVTVPHIRTVARASVSITLDEIEKLLMHKVHEYRLIALHILVLQFEESSSQKARAAIVRFYLAHTSRINNWDLVDSSARYILGEYLHDTNRAVLYKLVMSHNIWERRIAIVATHAFIARGDFADTFKLAEMLLGDTEDLIHKATGWMLREVGKHSEASLRGFLDTHAQYMPRTALRYAIERLSTPEKKKYLATKPRYLS